MICVHTWFCQEPVVIVADVEAMFHKLKVPTEDADLLRFLLWLDGDTSKLMAKYRMGVHLFRLFCFLIMQTILSDDVVRTTYII